MLAVLVVLVCTVVRIAYQLEGGTVWKRDREIVIGGVTGAVVVEVAMGAATGVAAELVAAGTAVAGELEQREDMHTRAEWGSERGTRGGRVCVRTHNPHPPPLLSPIHSQVNRRRRRSRRSGARAARNHRQRPVIKTVQ